MLQGFFGGGLQPNQQSIILDTFPPAQRGRAFSLTAIATVVAPVLGPTVGGWITDSFSWRWVFFINVPVGLLTAFAVMSLVEDPPWVKKQTKVSIDYIGISLIALTFASFQIMLDRGEDADWFSSDFIMHLRGARGGRRRRRRWLAAVRAQAGGGHPRPQGSQLRASAAAPSPVSP